MAQGQYGKHKCGEIISASRVVFITVLPMTQKLAYVSWGKQTSAKYLFFGKQISTFIQHGGRVVGDNLMRQ